MAVAIEIEYEGNLLCKAVHSPSQDTLMTDAPLDNGGKASAFSPTDLVATALGTCMLTIMGIAAQRVGRDITGTRIRVIKEMASEPVRRIGALEATITLPPGLELSDADKTRLEHAAKVCPVKQSLHPDVRIEMKFVYPH